MRASSGAISQVTTDGGQLQCHVLGKTQAKGIVNQASGAAQDLYGQAKDTATEAAGVARDKAASFQEWVRHNIETQPYTAVVVALAIGWLLGRTHRPL